MSAAPDAAALPRAVPIPGGSVLCGHRDPCPGGPSEVHRAGADTGMLRPHLGTAIRAEFSWGKAAGQAGQAQNRGPGLFPRPPRWCLPPLTERSHSWVLALEGEPRASGKLALAALGGAGLQACGPGDTRHGSRTWRCRSDPCPSISHFACHCFCTLCANTNTEEANNSISVLP